MNAEFAFQHIGLDREEPLRNQPLLLDEYWQFAQVVVLNEQGEACCFDAQTLFYPAQSIAMQRPANACFLGLHDGQGFFLLSLDCVAIAPHHTVSIRAAAAIWPALHTSIFAQAKALLHWHSQSKYCGRCSFQMRVQTAGYSAHCSRCELVTYPQTHPASIMCVSDGDSILLGRQAVWPEKRWSVLAGFVEPGESPEQTVVREVFEEAGVRVTRVQYVISQPWPMPMALMLGFEAFAEKQTITLSEELQDARWFTRKELNALIASGELQLPDPISISHYLITRWLENERGNVNR